MTSFTMCTSCRAEYDDPHNRRFHAQPTACPVCGPRLTLLDRSGRRLPATDPITQSAQALLAGSIVAIKGLGGYHLACLAHENHAVAELRTRKHRHEKPFAVMVPDLAAAAALCEISSDEAALLNSRSRPIVLLRRKPGTQIAEEVAPGNPFLGVMLPYTPLHHLLLHEIPGHAVGDQTSGNQSDEPIAFDDGDAVARLGTIADFFLSHDRPIHIRCDDSVTRIVAGTELPLRRSRGHARNRFACRCDQVPTLATGGQMKATFALARDHNAFLSHHIGDLDYYEAARSHSQAMYTMNNYSTAKIVLGPRFASRLPNNRLCSKPGGRTPDIGCSTPPCPYDKLYG